VWLVAHSPAVGVKVYNPLLMLLMAGGFQVPEIPFNEEVFKTGAG